MTKWLHKAYRETARSTHHRQQVAAVVVRGGALLACASNTGRYRRHAEVRALRRGGDYQGATLYVVRANGGISKPCEMCMKAIEEAGISEVVYIGQNRLPTRLKVSLYVC